MKSEFLKCATLSDIKKMQSFYGKENLYQNSQRISVLIKNLQLMLKHVSSEKIVLADNAYPEFYQLVSDFMSACEKREIKLPGSISQSLKKIQIKQAKKAYLQQKKLALQMDIIEQRAQGNGKGLKNIINRPKQYFQKMLQCMTAASISLCPSLISAQNSVPAANKEKMSNLITMNMSEKTNQNVELVEFSPVGVMRCSDELLKNEKDYQEFTDQLLAQFKENISTLQDSKTNKRKFYQEQGALIEKYGKSKYIIPKASCEAMSFATFLRVLEENSLQSNNITEACKEILLQIPNPHACFSSKGTFASKYSRNLRKDIESELKNKDRGIYMIWLKRGNGRLHRMTIIGTGTGDVYLLGFNNNRIVKMQKDNLDKLTNGSGYYFDFGDLLKDKAKEKITKNNTAAVNQQASNQYLAMFYQVQKQY